MKGTAQGLSFIVIGFGIGWLVGLSATQVVSVVISALVGVIAAVSTVASTPNSSSQDGSTVGGGLVAPWSVALITSGLVIGSVTGVLARTHDWFGMDIVKEVGMWTQLGLDEADVAQAIFDSRYGREGSDIGTRADTTLGVLFNVPGSECSRLAAFRLDDLQAEMGLSPNETIRLLAEKTDDPELLRAGVEELCRGT